MLFICRRTCQPVCSQGCDRDHGDCVSPDICECQFGWTSLNCSVKCHCNEHGQCANETHLGVCQDCRNHTVVRSLRVVASLYCSLVSFCRMKMVGRNCLFKFRYVQTKVACEVRCRIRKPVNRLVHITKVFSYPMRSHKGWGDYLTTDHTCEFVLCSFLVTISWYSS